MKINLILICCILTSSTAFTRIDTSCRPDFLPQKACEARLAFNGEEGYTKHKFPGLNRVESVGHYYDGQQTGFWKFFYDNGNPRLEGHFQNGQKEGFWRSFYDSGKLREEGHFNNCKKDGFWRYSYPSGRMEAEGHYVQGLKQGHWVFNYENGERSWEGELNCN